MRLFAPLITSALLAALLPSGVGAAVSIDLVFVQVNGSKITETSGVVVTPGDSVLMEVRLVTTEPLAFVSYSLQFDDVLGADQLDVSGVAEWDGVATANACTVFQEIFTPIAPGVVVEESVGSLPGTIKSFDGASSTVTLPGGTYVMGTVAWSTTFLRATATVESGVFATGIDLIGDASFNDITASTTFNSATIEKAP